MNKLYKRATILAFELNDQIHYCWVLGNQNNPALLFIPGYTGIHSDLLEVAERLKEKYFVIIPDLPGWGKSPRFSAELTMQNYAKYLKSFLDYLEVQHITLVGHCMGAVISIELTHENPDLVSKLFLVSTPYLQGTSYQHFFSHLNHFARRSPKRIRPIFFVWRSRIITTPYTFYTLKVKSFRKRMRLVVKSFKYQPKQLEDTVEENFSSMMDYNFERVKNITSPIHLIHGAKDQLITPNRAVLFHELIPQASLDLIPDAGHIPPTETPHTLARLILTY